MIMEVLCRNIRARSGQLFLIGVALLLAPEVKAQSFQDFISHLYSLPSEQRQAAVDSFLAVTTEYPVIEYGTLAHFIYTGAPSSVTVPGDANNWDPSSSAMSRVQGTTLWYYSRSFEADARLDYKFVISGSTWILDPRNPRQVSGGFGPNSELPMPQYVQPPEIQYDPAIPHGTLRDTTWYSVYLGNSRTVRVYTPPGYDATADSFSVAYFHDGLEYDSLASADNTIDYLIAQNKIDPIMAVFIPPVNRTEEYAGSLMTAFSQFMVSEIVPYIDGRYRTIGSPSARVVIGASFGGNISLWLGYHYPEIFGRVGAYSSYIADTLARGFSQSPNKDLSLYLDLGTYDKPALIPMVRAFIPILGSKAYEYEYHEYHEGHSWGNWRAHLDNALELFFGKVTSTEQSDGGRPVPDQVELCQNYPNPFNPSTTIVYRLGKGGHAELTVYDLLGRIVERLLSGEVGSGEHSVQWDASDHPSGLYVYQLSVGDLTQRRKMVLVR
jgi:enterochelin esterase-like enzyme